MLCESRGAISEMREVVPCAPARPRGELRWPGRWAAGRHPWWGSGTPEQTDQVRQGSSKTHTRNMTVVSAVDTFKNLVGSVPDDIVIPDDIDAIRVATSWLARLAQATRHDEGYEGIFVLESHFRDHIALTASLRPISSRPAVIAAWSQCTQRARPFDFALVPGSARVIRAGPGLAWIQGRYTFGTCSPPARCSGTFRLLPDVDGQYRAWIISSTVESLDGHEPDLTLQAPPLDLETVSRVEVLIIGCVRCHWLRGLAAQPCQCRTMGHSDCRTSRHCRHRASHCRLKHSGRR
jgi:hypothetical protein